MLEMRCSGRRPLSWLCCRLMKKVFVIEAAVLCFGCGELPCPPGTSELDGRCVTAGDCPQPMLCTPGAPMGFLGPVVVLEGDARPSCPANYPVTGVDAQQGLIDVPATCTCECGAPQGAGCGPMAVVGYGPGLLCRGVPRTMMESFANGECRPHVPLGGATHADVSAPVTTAGACVPTGSSDVPPPRWGTFARACGLGALPLAACVRDAETGVCVPEAPAEMGGHVCVFAMADVTCPESYPDPRQYFTDAEDTRGCAGDCACGGSTGVSCATAFFQSACSGGIILGGEVGTCGPIPETSSSHVAVSIAPTGGTCAAAGNAPTGTLVPAGIVTVCCR